MCLFNGGGVNNRLLYSLSGHPKFHVGLGYFTSSSKLWHRSEDNKFPNAVQCIDTQNDQFALLFRQTLQLELKVVSTAPGDNPAPFAALNPGQSDLNRESDRRLKLIKLTNRFFHA
jgi:hypothetical protein